MQAIYGWDLACDPAAAGVGTTKWSPHSAVAANWSPRPVADRPLRSNRAFASGVPYLVNIATDPGDVYPAFVEPWLTSASGRHAMPDLQSTQSLGHPLGGLRRGGSWCCSARPDTRSAPSVLDRPAPRGVRVEPQRRWGSPSASTCCSNGFIGPFAAALQQRFGLRRVTATALLVIAVGSGRGRIRGPDSRPSRRRRDEAARPRMRLNESAPACPPAWARSRRPHSHKEKRGIRRCQTGAQRRWSHIVPGRKVRISATRLPLFSPLDPGQVSL